MTKVTAIDYYNLLISRLNRLIDKQINTYHDQPITPDININFITGTNNGLKLALDIMEELAEQLNKKEIVFKDNGRIVELLDGEKSIPMPHEIRKKFNYE